MRAYMLEIVAPEKHSSTAKMEAIPGFYFLYSRIFLRVVRKSDLWESTQSHGKDHFEVTMKKCLWHTACVENGCAELCPLFCEVDNVTYGGLRKLGFAAPKRWATAAIAAIFTFSKNENTHIIKRAGVCTPALFYFCLPHPRFKKRFRASVT